MATFVEKLFFFTCVFFPRLFYYYIEAIISAFIPKNPKSVGGKLALVTGAGHGIGKEIALELARKGAKLVLWDINKANNESTATEIRSMGESATTYVVDVTKSDEIRKTADQMRRDVGDVEILVNNAGILYGGELLKMKEQHIRRTFDVNTLAHFWTVQEFMPAMLEKNSGHIVTIASMSAKSGTAYLVDYSASKYAAYGFTEALNEEIIKLGKPGVKTTTVNPMFVNTGLVKEPKDRIFPILKPQHVAMETVKGIQYEEEFVYIPRSLNIQLKVSGSSKSAVFGFTDALREELLKLGKPGVKTTTVCPSFVSSGMVKQIKDKIMEISTPETVGREVVKGIQCEEEHVYIPRHLHVGLKLQAFFPLKFVRWLKEFGDQGIVPQYDPNS